MLGLHSISGGPISDLGSVRVIHATSGALVGQAATLAGTATRNRLHGSVGALIAQGSIVVGAAVRGVQSHQTSGNLAGTGAVIDAMVDRVTPIGGPGGTSRYRAPERSARPGNAGDSRPVNN